MVLGPWGEKKREGGGAEGKVCCKLSVLGRDLKTVPVQGFV